MMDELTQLDILERLQVILSAIFNRSKIQVKKSFLHGNISVKFSTNKKDSDWNKEHLYYLLENYLIENLISYGSGWHIERGDWVIIELNKQPLQFYCNTKLQALMLGVEEVIKYLGIQK